MRKEQFISLLLILGILLAGCAKLVPPRSTLPPETTGSAPAATEASTQPQSTEVPTEPLPTEPPVDRNKMLDAYQFVLQQFAFEHIWPDGTDLDFDNTFGFIEENEFCIADVDSDGVEELVISFSTAPMAGMQARVFGFDSTNVIEELCAFPALTFYSHGLLKVFASHNHSMHMEFWPYSLMQYNPVSHSYDLIASVSGWQKEYFPEDHEGNTFPDDIADGQGEVYLVSVGDKQEILSPAQFAQWEADNLGSETVLDLETRSTSEAQIKAVIHF